VTLVLPCSGAGGAVIEEGVADAVEPRRTGRILLVEDNDEVGEFAEDLLTELGHEVNRTHSGEEALRLAGQGRFDAVFTDVVMPGMSGLELADKLAELEPRLPVVLTTGFSDEIARSGTGGRPVILKPYRLETLAAALDQVLAGEK
jgi:CheY-like chemotaxis protein